MFLESSLLFSRTTDDWTAYLEGRRYRNLVNQTTAAPANQRAFDDNVVQLLPAAGFATADRPFLGSWLNERVLWNVRANVKNFTRTTTAYDYDPSRGASVGDTFIPGTDILRKATRLTVAPALYAPVRVGDVLMLTPSAEYREYFYSFHNEVPNLSRSYALLQLSAQMQWERVYEMDNPDAPRLKHLIRPELTYSRIPFYSEDQTHPFYQQIAHGKALNLNGYYFDNEDFVPLNTNTQTQAYYIPLGHTLSYGVTSQLIRRIGRDGSPAPGYLKNVDFSAGQSLNILEYAKDDKSEARPFTRFFSSLSTEFGPFTTLSHYYYYPYYAGVRHVFDVSGTYILERGLHERVLTFDRSLTLSYAYNKLDPTAENVQGGGQLNFSINDYILPSARAQYSFTQRQILTAGGGVLFQSPSQCWRFSTTIDYKVQENTVVWGVDLSLNLTGEGFGGVSDLAARRNN
jgi:hypothetical protein